MAQTPRTAPLRRRRRLVVAALGGVVAFAVVEFGLRAVLFLDVPVGWRLRRASLYAHHQASDDYFLLQRRFGQVGEVPVALRHTTLGWVSEALDASEPLRVVHRELDVPFEGRPVLLYGDSYAHGTTPRGERIEDHFADLDDTRRYRLLNHGVRGYGLDQIVLLVEATLDSALASLGHGARPIVVLGVHVDDDLDRCALALRGWPKPWFVLEDGALALHGVPVPTLSEYAARHSLEPTCFVARLVLHADTVWPAALHRRVLGLEALRPRKEALTAALVQRFGAFARARPVDVLVLSLAGESRTTDDGARDWRDAALESAAATAGLPWLDSAPALRAAAASEGLSVQDLFGRSGQTLEHFNSEGNRLAARVLLEALDAGRAN